MSRLVAAALAVMLAGLSSIPAHPAGDLAGQQPIEVRVELGGKSGELKFSPDKLTFETGKLYKLVLVNPSPREHYFTAPEFATKIFTRKVVITSPADPKKALGEIKGAIREIEVFPGGTAEWWFVPVATGSSMTITCDVKDPDGKSHLHKGMKGEISIQ